MEPGASRDDRFITLLQAASALDTAAEKRDFLERVCDGDPALLAELLHAELPETATFESGPDSARPSESHFLPSGEVVEDRFEIVRLLAEDGFAYL
jgi:hypothetical protein